MLANINNAPPSSVIAPSASSEIAKLKRFCQEHQIAIYLMDYGSGCAAQLTVQQSTLYLWINTRTYGWVGPTCTSTWQQALREACLRSKDIRWQVIRVLLEEEEGKECYK